MRQALSAPAAPGHDNPRHDEGEDKTKQSTAHTGKNAEGSFRDVSYLSAIVANQPR